jgi:hypothetical protein
MALAGLAASGCDLVFLEEQPPIDATGVYTINTIRRDNGCHFDGWVVGEPLILTLDVVQEGANVEATIKGGFVDAGYILAVGSNVFRGEIRRSRLDLEIIGTVPRLDTCPHTIDSRLDVRIDTDTLTGTLDLRVQPAAPGCVLENCRSYLELNGIRPL